MNNPFFEIQPDEYDYCLSKPLFPDLIKGTHPRDFYKIFDSAIKVFQKKKWPLGEPFEIKGSISIQDFINPQGFKQWVHQVIESRAKKHEELRSNFLETFNVFRGEVAIELTDEDETARQKSPDNWTPKYKYVVDPRLLNMYGYVLEQAPKAHFNQAQFNLAQKIINTQAKAESLYNTKAEALKKSLLKEHPDLFNHIEFTRDLDSVEIELKTLLTRLDESFEQE